MLADLARSLRLKRTSVIRIKSAELGALLFGRMTPSHQSYFDSVCGQHSRIPLRHLPHYRFWRDGEEAQRDGAYRRFLECDVAAPAVETQVSRYLALKKQILADGVQEPITLFTAPDGKEILVDGHCRAAIAYAFGLDVPCVRLDLQEALRQIVSNQDEFYGTRNANRPYQSVFYGEREILAGRRRDVIERFQKLDIVRHVRGKSVLDLGSNIGVNAITAWYFGARAVTAVEISPTIAAAALRLATVLQARVDVKVHDLGTLLVEVPPCDTVFCLSVFKHVSDKEALAQSIARLTRCTLYFEGHENSCAEDYAAVFRHFSSVELIGFNRDGIHSTASTRPFFRCAR
jgi:SAM-dependent methyltransferase